MASRLWWMLRSIGHGQVAVLDGGYQAWVAAGHALRHVIETRPPANYPRTGDWTGIVGADAVAEGAALGATIVDARAPERFRGEVEPLDSRAGHIPGAINRYHADNLDTSGKHRSLPELVGAAGGHRREPDRVLREWRHGMPRVAGDVAGRRTAGAVVSRVVERVGRAIPTRPIATGD